MDSSIPPKTEFECQQMLREYHLERGANEEYIQSQIDFIFPTTGGFISRFEYIDSFLTEENKEHLLISGAAVGSELIQALNYGFKSITGTEVLKIYTDISEIRLKEIKNANVDFYNGEDLDYPDDTFTSIMSGHIIEHTSSPYIYLREHLRVLRDQGIFFLEFPDRNHDTELHTGTTSYEKHPKFIRDSILYFLSSPLNLNKDKRKKYSAVRRTLNQVSIKDIMQWISETDYNVEIVDSEQPHPGFTRVILRKV